MATPEKLRLLIVEDDVVDRRLLQRLLAKSSLGTCEVDYADCLAGALERLAAHPFNLVLLDLGLPDSRGMESVVELQRHAPCVPIIVLSGLDDEDTATRAVQKGVQDYLIKGQVDGTLLVRSIRYALERKKAERELQVAEKRYRMIFENSAVAIMMADKEGRLVSWNQFTERLLGMTREDLLGRSVRSLYPPAEWNRICGLNVRRKGMQHHLETQMIRGQGDVIDVDISLSVLTDAEGATTGSIGVVRDITERKDVEGALRESEKRFRQVVENAKEWIWEIDVNGVYTYASPIVQKILGYEPDEILGKKRFHDFFHPEDARQLKTRAFEILRQSEVFSEFQTRNVHKNGQTVWLTRSGVPVFNDKQELVGYRGVDVDITERMRTHEILDRKQKNLEAIFDAAPVGMLLVNDEVIVVRANETIRHMSGKDYHSIIDQHPCRALGCGRFEAAGEPANCDECHLATVIETVLQSGKPIRGLEIRPVLSDNGQVVRPWLLVRVEPLSIDAGRHVVVALDDITDRKHAEEKLREAIEMKSQFISTVSHELRTPLTSIREAVIIILDEVAGRINKDQRHFLDVAKRNIERLSRLINDVLDFQKLNAGKMTFVFEESAIEKAVEDAFHTMCPHGQKQGVHLSLNCQPNLPKIAFDSDRIIQVVTNLISNAIKFTPEGGRVSVSVQQRGEHLVIVVNDTGLGIPKESLAKVFERFYRVHRPGREIKGTGLGLAIVNKIVAGHGGRIDVESELGKGTTFTVLLPLNRQRAPELRPDQIDAQLETTLTDGR